MSDTETVNLKQFLLAIEGCWFPATSVFLLVIGLTVLDRSQAEATNAPRQSLVQAALEQYQNVQSQLVTARTRSQKADPIVRLRASFLRAEFT